MAVTTVLKMKFDTMRGSKTWSFKYAKSASSIASADVKALGQAMITNGSIYRYHPTALTDARVVTTTEDVFDLDD